MDILHQQDQLQNEARAVVTDTPLLALLSELGDVTQTGSSVTGLMVYPDIDFALQHEQPEFKKIVELVPRVVAELSATAIKIAHFQDENGATTGGYIGMTLPHNGRNWHIDATVGKPGPIHTNPPELAGWLEHMNSDERLVILELKKELIDTGRYMGAQSRPPHTFRSTHLYEAVLAGQARTVRELEQYFTQQV